MPRVRKGREVERGGKWYARLGYTTAAGERKDLWLPARNKTDAASIIKKKLRELEEVGESALDGDKVRCTQLAALYRERKLVPAKIVEGRKVAGLKNVRTPRRILQTLVGHFGDRRIKAITHPDIEQFKLLRLDTRTPRGQRQVAGVNRELEVLRAVFKFAVREGWLYRSPFELGDPLISRADEVRRERILSHEEERRLLNACEAVSRDGRRRWSHLRPLIVAALDTACRRGELFKLRWRDVDLAAHTITIIAASCKTERPRTVGITPRLLVELMRLWESSEKDAGGLVFGLSSTIKHGWKTICKVAGIEGLRPRDLGHAAITRMVRTRQPSALIMKVSGHTQHSTFSRYVNPDSQSVVRVADALDALNSGSGAVVQVGVEVDLDAPEESAWLN